MSVIQIIILIFVSMAGNMLQTAFGFGFGPAAMAVFPMILPYNQAIVLFLILALISNLVLSIIYIRHINFKVLLPILIPSVLICMTTAYFAVEMNTSVIYFALGILLVALAVYFFIFTGKIRIKPTLFNGVITGIICGVIGGFFGLSGPLAAFYFLPALEDKDEYVGTFQFYFLILNLMNLLVRIVKGSFAVENVPITVYCIAALVAGTLLGYFVFRNFRGKWFERGVYALVGLNGLWIVISFFLK